MKENIKASLAFVRGIDRSPVNSPHKGPVTRKMFPSDDVIMNIKIYSLVPVNRCLIVISRKKISTECWWLSNLADSSAVELANFQRDLQALNTDVSASYDKSSYGIRKWPPVYHKEGYLVPI